MRTCGGKDGVAKQAIVLQWAPCETSNLEKSNRLAHCPAVLCKNHCDRVTQTWTSLSEEEEKERI